MRKRSAGSQPRRGWRRWPRALLLLIFFAVVLLVTLYTTLNRSSAPTPPPVTTAVALPAHKLEPRIPVSEHPEAVTKCIVALQEDMRESKHNLFERKINREGKYLRFPGNTIIAKLSPVELEKWQMLYAILNQSDFLPRFYSPLPLTSYHMTVFELFHKGNRYDFSVFNDYVSCIEPRLRLLANHLLNEPLVLKHVRAAKVRFSDSLLAISMDVVSPEDLSHLSSFQALARNISGLQWPPSHYSYHLTLAYRIPNGKKMGELDQTRFEWLKHEVTKFLQTSVPADRWDMTLNPAAVVTFEDMTRFVEYYPEGIA